MIGIIIQPKYKLATTARSSDQCYYCVEGLEPKNGVCFVKKLDKLSFGKFNLMLFYKTTPSLCHNHFINTLAFSVLFFTLPVRIFDKRHNQCFLFSLLFEISN